MEFSFVSSLIHTEQPTQGDYGAVFKINVLLAFLFILIGSSAAYLMSLYYDQPQLLVIYLFLLPILLVNAINSVQNAGLKKNLRIKQFSIIELCSIVVSTIITLILLLDGQGVIAIVYGQLIKYFSACLLLMLNKDYLSVRNLGTDELRKKHWNYGKYILGEKSLGIGMSYLDTFLVHHFLGASVLGIYDLLKRMVFRPLLAAYNALEQVVFPMLSNAVNKNSFRKIFSSYLNVNAFFFLSLIGVVVTPFLLRYFPPLYREYENILQLVILLAISILIFNPVDIVCYSLGLTRKYFHWVLFYSLVQIALTIWTLSIGLVVFLKAIILFNLITYLLSYFVLIRKHTSIKFWEWGRLAFILMLFVLCYLWF